MLFFYYFKEVIHSLIRQSNRELEAANGQLLRRAPGHVSEPARPAAHDCPQDSPASAMEPAVTTWTADPTQHPLTEKGLRVSPAPPGSPATA